MLIKKSQIPILAVNIISLIIFIIIFLSKENYEFLIYVGVIIFFLLLIISTNKKVNYPNDLLWGLTVWSLLHMIGGGIFIGSKKVYEIMLWPIIGAPYHVFKYDQLIHAIGFGIATLLMYHLLKPSLSKKRNWISLSIVIVMAGLGAGALNEIIEFIATVTMPQTGVGGYENTSLDLISNLIGAIIAMLYIWKSEKACSF